jgi:aminoglycoside phosphotransferase (APT) family kinase protein
MTSVLDRVTDAAGGAGLSLAKAVPAEPGHLLLELADADGGPVAGQWFADREHAAEVARDIEARTRDPKTGTRPCVHVPVLSDSGVLLQPSGADRRLPALHRLAASPGAVLVAHRPERRGLVRRMDGNGPARYTKVVRARRLADTFAAAQVAVDGIAVPRVTATDAAAGTMTCEELPGRSLHELLADPATTASDLRAVGGAVGDAVARLHRARPPAERQRSHDAAAEVEVTRHWVAQAGAFGLLERAVTPVRAALDALNGFRSEPAGPPAYLHRDLHDKQLLVTDGCRVGMLDFDLAATGEPALDLANLLVHLELRTLQGMCPSEKATACARALVDGYAPGPDTWRRLPGYALAARLRLAAVYSFRPGGGDVGLALLTEGAPGPLHDLKERR